MRSKIHDEEMIYLYVLTRSHGEDPLNLSVKGVGGRGDEVYSMPFLDLAFVVSNSPQDEYETTRAHTINHQLVCEETLNKGLTVLPVRFSTVARPTPGKSSAEAKIAKLMRRRYGEFESLLREMEDKVELGLKVFWRRERFFRDIVAGNPDIRRTRDRLSANPHSHRDRIELGTLVANAIEAHRDVDAQMLAGALSPLAERYETNKILIDMMCLNAAFLVHRSRVEAFDRKVNELDAKYGERMMFKYVGETPPFNFVEIVVHWEDED